MEELIQKLKVEIIEVLNLEEMEPEDIDTLSIDMTDIIAEKVAPMIGMVLAELDRLNVSWQKRSLDSVSRNTIKNHSD